MTSTYALERALERFLPKLEDDERMHLSVALASDVDAFEIRLRYYRVDRNGAAKELTKRAAREYLSPHMFLSPHVATFVVDELRECMRALVELVRPRQWAFRIGTKPHRKRLQLRLT